MMTDETNKKRKNKYVHLAISLYGKSNVVRIFKDVIRTLGFPKYICLRIKNNDSFAIIPSDVKEIMSFMVPANLFKSKHVQFSITSKRFISTVIEQNNLSPNYTYRLFGYYSAKENAVFFNINNADVIKYKKSNI